jgi:type IX secretion system PorP/SprF family membrane protein
MKKKLYISLAIGILSCTISYGQDIHFSQPEFSPMSTNPALTGTDAPLRFGLNYRNQWPVVGAQFSTVEATADIRFGEEDQLKTSFLALGINLYNDLSNAFNVMTNKANFNLSYHLAVDDHSRVGVGLYGGFGQRSINTSRGKWASQYDGLAYNENLASGEDLARPSFMYFDAGFGVDYRYEQGEQSFDKNDKRILNAGIALYHVNQPAYSVVYSNKEDLPIRFSYFLNGEIGIDGKRNSFRPGLYINHQKSAFELLYGSYYTYMIQEGSKITGFRNATVVAGGIFHRWNDAIILKGLLEIKSFAVGMSYDVNISKLSNASSTVGAIEVFLMYRTRYSKKYDDGGGTL